MIGRLKIVGLFILKILGVKVNWLILWYCFFLRIKVINKMIVKVILELLILIVKVFMNGFVMMCGNFFLCW